MKVATWNVGDGIDAVKVHGLVKLRKHGADVIGLQECGDRGRMIDQFCDRTGWHAWLGDGSPGASSVPILWNPRTVHATHTGTRDATDPTNTGRKGAGPDVVKAKVWNKVRFEVDDADDLVINGHGPASIWWPPRLTLAKRYVAELADLVEHREEPIADNRVDVIAVMDGNAKPTHRLWQPLRELGMVQRTHEPTHGRRTIDLVWTLGCVGRVQVLDMPSDHNAALFAKETR